MLVIDWNEIALRCGSLIGELRRGVMKISNLGFYVLFVPNSEQARVERALADEYFPIHGTALHTTEEEESIFVAVVKADSAEKLRTISHMLDSATSKNPSPKRWL